MKILARVSVLAMLVATVGLFGCGDDTTIIQGGGGAGGAIPTTADVETCGVCHNSVADIHAPMGVSAVEIVSIDTATDISVPADGVNDLVVEFDGLIDGLPAAGYTFSRGNIYYEDEDLLAAQATVDQYPGQIETDQAFNIRGSFAGTVTPNLNIPGRYVLTVDATDIPGTTVTPAPVAPLTPAGVVNMNASYLVRLNAPAGADGRPHLVVDLGTPPARDLVTDAACAACHGPFPAFSEKFTHAKVGGADCQKCHQIGRRTTGYITRDVAGDLFTQNQVDTDVPADGVVDSDPFVGGNLVEYIHGIHNSHNMPEMTYFRTTAPDGAANIEDRYSIGFPSDMRNCSVCHVDDGAVDRNEIVASAPPSYYLCLSCHNNFGNFPSIAAAGSAIAFHLNLGPQTTCTTANCHDGNVAPNEAAGFHDEFLLDSHSDSYFRGEDISFTNPDNVTFALGNVTADGSNVEFTWTASKNGVAVDPCNTDLGTGPTYQELGAYLAYAKGDDWVNEFVSANPGQPDGAQDLFGELVTTCDPATNVATTTGLVMNADALAYADKVLLAIGGKPADRFNGVAGQDYFVREVSPTFAFDPATGAAATQRRQAVDNDKCLGCHQGTLYQHGGDRVDNEQICVICHNPSSSDKHNRKELYAIVNADGTVNTDATYDGKDSETFDMRVMIHSIHGVNKRVVGSDAGSPKPWTIYRGRGIYQFVPQLYGPIAGDEGETEAIDFPTPEGWTTGSGQPIFGSTNGSTQTHNFVTVHYPRPANECTACHNDEAFEAPNQALAVPLTVDPVGPDYANQADDIVIGPAAAACTACHAETTTRIHALQDFGYKANVEKEVMLEQATQ